MAVWRRCLEKLAGVQTREWPFSLVLRPSPRCPTHAGEESFMEIKNPDHSFAERGVGLELGVRERVWWGSKEPQGGQPK